ncbi:hypothetical protein F8154_14625 [Alkaliphilus pronyensis]|uniref:Uncharacterized protein n=1 Tax=Alkaliphilus pronyensis TaxID=1482732 RepID=A0A6I0FBJ1_9FIRM|nr:DUF5986 family protein [Alkaliphilus pronyensis]KAB3529598.1 hypothetical protein F8154_14625 [Alkaliphilus pronyensis]
MSFNMEGITIELIVDSLQNAMRKANFNMIQNDTKINMSVHNGKWDCIVTKIFDNMNNSNYKLSILDLGIFKVVFIYEKNSKLLFSVMRQSNYNDLLQGKKKVTHYANCSLSFNKNLPRKAEQLSMVDLPELTEKEKDILDWKKGQIINGLGIEEKDVKHYITIVFKEQNFVLEDVEAFLTNEYYEIIESISLSEHIKSDVYESSHANTDQDIPIRIKPNKAVSNSEPELDININIKKEKKIN